MTQLPQPILHRPSKSIILPPTYSSLLSEIPKSRMADMGGRSVVQIRHTEEATKKLNEMGFEVDSLCLLDLEIVEIWMLEADSFDQIVEQREDAKRGGK